MFDHVLCAAEIASFHENGYITVRGFASPAELLAMGRVFEAFMSRELSVSGKDWGDHPRATQRHRAELGPPPSTASRLSVVASLGRTMYSPCLTAERSR